MPAQRHYGGHDLVVSVFSNILSRWHCWIEALLGGIPLIVATEEKADSRGRRGAGPGSCHTNTLATNTTLVAIAEKKKTRTTTTQLYIIVATKEKADRATEALDQGLINTVAASTDGKIEKSQVQIKICPNSSLCFHIQKLIGESDFHIILINQVCHLLHAQHLLISHHAVSSSHVFRRQGGVIVAPRRGGLLCPQWQVGPVEQTLLMLPHVQMYKKLHIYTKVQEARCTNIQDTRCRNVQLYTTGGIISGHCSTWKSQNSFSVAICQTFCQQRLNKFYTLHGGELKEQYPFTNTVQSTNLQRCFLECLPQSTPPSAIVEHCWRFAKRFVNSTLTSGRPGPKNRYWWALSASVWWVLWASWW